MEKEKRKITENSTNLNIYLGTYNGAIIKTKYTLKQENEKEEKKNKSNKAFSFKASENMIKTIFPYEDEFIFTSGTDEIIRIFNTKNNEEKGVILSYSGSVSKLNIFKNYIIAMCDTNIEFFKLKNFNKVNTLKGHKFSIINFIVHSTGKLMFSIGRDNYLMMWNLNNYKCSFKYKFDGVELVSLNWMKNESLVCLGFVNKILILDYLKESEDFNEWKVVEYRIKSSFQNPGKILDVRIVRNKVFIFKTNFQVEVLSLKENAEGEKVDYTVNYYKLSDEENTKEEENEPRRLKFVEIAIKENEKNEFLVTVNSKNEIFVYSLFDFTTKNEGNTENEEFKLVKSIKKIDLMVDRFTTLALAYE